MKTIVGCQAAGATDSGQGGLNERGRSNFQGVTSRERGAAMLRLKQEFPRSVARQVLDHAGAGEFRAPRAYWEEVRSNWVRQVPGVRLWKIYLAPTPSFLSPHPSLLWLPGCTLGEQQAFPGTLFCPDASASPQALKNGAGHGLNPLKS